MKDEFELELGTYGLGADVGAGLLADTAGEAVEEFPAPYLEPLLSCMRL